MSSDAAFPHQQGLTLRYTAVYVTKDGRLRLIRTAAAVEVTPNEPPAEEIPPCS